MADLTKRDRTKDKLIAQSSAEIQRKKLERAGITDQMIADALHAAFQAAVLDLNSVDPSARNAARRDIFRLSGVDRPMESVQSQQVVIPVPAWGKVSIETKQPHVIDAEVIEQDQAPDHTSRSSEPAQDQEESPQEPDSPLVASTPA